LAVNRIYCRKLIFFNADKRKATVTLAFNGVTRRTAMITIILIVEAMGYTLRDFSKIYSEITDKQFSDFKKENNI